MSFFITTVEYNNKIYYGVLLFWKGHQKFFMKGFKGWNRNRVFLQGVIDGLQMIKRKDLYLIFSSDLDYFNDAIRYKNYINWFNDGWVKSNGDTVAYKDMWLEIMYLLDGFQVVNSKKLKNVGILQTEIIKHLQKEECRG